MSFIIQDKFLSNKLIRIGQNAPQPDPTLNFSVVDSLLENLDTKIQSYNQFYSQRPNTEIFVKDLENDYNFLHFLSRNGIRDDSAGSKPLAYFHIRKNSPEYGNQEVIKIEQLLSQDKEYFKYPAPKDAKGDDFNFWVNKNAIIAFLSLLYDRSKEEDKGGDLMRLMIDKLINLLNTNSGQNLNPKENAGTDKDKTNQTLNPEWALDALPKIINLNNHYEDGPLQLKVKDLNSDNTFKSWVGTNRPQILENNEQKDLANKENICKLISYLQLRAENYQQKDRKQNEQTTALVNYYVTQINSIAKQNNCSVGSKTPGTSDKDKEDKDNKDKSKDNTSVKRNIDILVRALPLRTTDIDFDRIGRFFNIARNIGNENVNSKIENIAATVSNSMSNLKNMVSISNKESADHFSFNVHPNDIISLLGDNYRRYNEFLNLYIEIVKKTSDAISMLLSYLEPQLEESSLYYMKAQVGWGGSEGSSVAYQNMAAIRQLMYNVDQAIRKVQTERLSRFSK